MGEALCKVRSERPLHSTLTVLNNTFSSSQLLLSRKSIKKYLNKNVRHESNVKYLMREIIIHPLLTSENETIKKSTYRLCSNFMH